MILFYKHSARRNWTSALLFVMTFTISTLAFASPPVVGTSSSPIVPTSVVPIVDQSLDANPSHVVVATRPSPSAPYIYINVFSHNEDPNHKDTPRLSDSESTATYWAFRDVTLRAATWLNKHNVDYNFQSDWNFLNALLQNEVNATPGPALTRRLRNTSGKNLVRYMAENLGIESDAHCHGNADTQVNMTPYNATDVTQLFSLAGVTASNILGGTVIDDPGYGNWPQYKTKVSGSVFPDHEWTFEAVMGGGRQSHTMQVYASGIWTPLAPTDASTYDNYYQIDPTSTFLAIGNYQASKETANTLIHDLTTGKLPPGTMLTMGFVFNISDLVIGRYGELDENDRIAGGVVNETYVERWFESNLGPLISLRDSGQVQFNTLQQSISTWRSLFGSQSFVCKQSYSNSHDCVIP